MKAEKFDQIVEARTNQRAQQKIDKFKKAIRDALGELGIWVSGYHIDSCLGQKEVLKIFAVLATGKSNAGWPKEIWDRERAEVVKSLLATFDEFQKALIAADRAEPGENSPEPQAVVEAKE